MKSVILLWLLAVTEISSIISRLRSQKCEELTIPLCRGLWYNSTRMPNMFHHETQEEANVQANLYTHLVTVDCSPDLHFFLCSVYTPICVENYDKPIPPCRAVCERARKGCTPVLNKYGYKWPSILDCNQFPKRPTNTQLCMNNRNSSSSMPSVNNKPKKVATKRPPSLNSNNEKPKKSHKVDSNNKHEILNTNDSCSCQCNSPFQRIDNVHHPYFNKVFTGGVSNCGHSCKLPYISRQTYKLIPLCLGMVTTIVIIFGLFNLLTVITNRHQLLKAPHRFILYISCCQMALTIGVIIRLIVGHERMVCFSYPSSFSSSSSSIGLLFMIRFQNSSPSLCSISFLFVYFFFLASILWWWILCLTWFLSDALGWDSKMIDKYSQVYHFVCWSIPGILSMIALTISAVDGDPYLGLCLIGQTSAAAHGSLVPLLLVPVVICTASGLFFLICGFTVNSTTSLSVKKSNLAVPQRHDSENSNNLSEFGYSNRPIKTQNKTRATTLTSLSTMATTALTTNNIPAKSISFERSKQMNSSVPSSLPKLGNTGSKQHVGAKYSGKSYYGYLGLVCAIPLCMTMAAIIYEVKWRDIWETSRNCKCKNPLFLNKGYTKTKSSSLFTENLEPPGITLAMLKYSSFFLIGIICGPWIWPLGTVKVWLMPIVKVTLCGMLPNGNARFFKDQRKPMESVTSEGFYNPQYPVQSPLYPISNQLPTGYDTTVNSVPLPNDNTKQLLLAPYSHSNIIPPPLPAPTTSTIDSDSYASYQSLSHFSSSQPAPPPSITVGSSAANNLSSQQPVFVNTVSSGSYPHISSINHHHHHMFSQHPSVSETNQNNWPLI